MTAPTVGIMQQVLPVLQGTYRKPVPGASSHVEDHEVMETRGLLCMSPMELLVESPLMSFLSPTLLTKQDQFHSSLTDKAYKDLWPQKYLMVSQPPQPVGPGKGLSKGLVHFCLSERCTFPYSHITPRKVLCVTFQGVHYEYHVPPFDLATSSSVVQCTKVAIAPLRHQGVFWAWLIMVATVRAVEQSTCESS